MPLDQEHVRIKIDRYLDDIEVTEVSLEAVVIRTQEGKGDFLPTNEYVLTVRGSRAAKPVEPATT